MTFVRKENKNQQPVNTSGVLTESDYRAIKDRLNYSSIKCFDTDRPRFYKEYILGERGPDIKSAAMTFGSIIHHLLSQGKVGDALFSSKYHILSAIKPTGQMGELVDKLYSLTVANLENGKQTKSFEWLFEESFNRVKFNFNGEEVAFKKKTLEYALGLFTGTSAELYYKECLENLGKEFVSMQVIESAEWLSNRVLEHRNTKDVYSPGEPGEDVFYELAILFDIDDVPYKSLLDMLRVNHKTKTIQPIDNKTSFDAENPERAYVKFFYYIQAALYDLAVKAWAKQQGYGDYRVLPMVFIFIDTKGFLDPLLLELSDDDIDRANRGFTLRGYRYNGLVEIQKELAWAIEHDVWSCSRKLYENNGRIKAKIPYGSKGF